MGNWGMKIDKCHQGAAEEQFIFVLSLLQRDFLGSFSRLRTRDVSLVTRAKVEHMPPGGIQKGKFKCVHISVSGLP
jgi:hypothetical protein